MKRVNVLAGAMLLVFTVPIAGFAQGGPGRGSGGWGPGSAYDRTYDPATIETVSGEVLEVAQFVPPNAAGRGVHLTLKTDKETIWVHLGPEWFIEKQDAQVAAGDTISVRGSRVTFEGKPTLIAAEIQKGDDLLMLRDARGTPRWSGSPGPYVRRSPRGRGGWGWGPGSDYARLYDAATVETLTGEVLEVGHFTARHALGRGVHLRLKTVAETIPVHLGPEWFVENQDFLIAVNDTVTVSGSRVTLNGESVVIAAEIRKDEGVLELRDAKGYPRWSGWRSARRNR